MAPQQQNSTFIDDNLDSCPSLLNLPESPILPTRRRCQNQDTTSSSSSNNNNNNNNMNNNNNNNNKRTAFEEQAPNPVTCKNKHGKENGNVGQASRRHRSISLYGVNSTVEQGQKEIPIWMDDGEPRYVSGVTNKTTCDDIIKALIDDELNNRKDGNYCGNNPKDGGQRTTAVAASRDYGDYIITESWGGVERSYDGNMAILPVWRAWSRVHNELRISLKHRDNFKDPRTMQLVPHSQPHSSFSMIKWLKKLFHLKKSKKNMPKHPKTPPKVPNKLKDQKQTVSNELVLVIMPDQLYKGTENAAKAKLYKLAENRVSKQRHRRRSRHEPSKLSVETFLTAIPSESNNNNYNINNNCIRRRKDKPLRNSVRNKLASLHADMNVRYEREYALTRQLSEKCRLYRLQNERYKGPEMEVSVGQLQENIEAYAEDIIKTEHELLELKNEIRHDISLINNLKRLTLEATEADKVEKPKIPQTSRKVTLQVAKNTQEMQFVDNIYEFCDNNASMLV
ncbi:protein CLEC16A homolog isoform X1 [Drosophila serrata]|uniref:protein CLEC16A homolog isoform X1 n=1 Tax=Drosophila serrata TaxID=7274 RepID=UPI000A1D31E8|nr:protein CLEC16A homolog isoform X1 [Drosophila serrata]